MHKCSGGLFLSDLEVEKGFTIMHKSAQSFTIVITIRAIIITMHKSSGSTVGFFLILVHT